MAEKKPIWSKVRLVFCRSSTRTKVLLLIPLVLASVVLLGLRWYLTDAEAENAGLRQQAAALEQENDRLEQSIAVLGTIQSVRQIAGEKLGLVDPDSSFFTPVTGSVNPQ